MARAPLQGLPGAGCTARCLAVLLLCALLPMAARAGMLITANALFEGRALLTIDGNRRLLRVGQSSPEGVRLLSASATEAVIDIEGRQQRLAPGAEMGAAFATPERRQVSVQRNERGEYRLVGTVNGHQLPLMVDTGANIVALSGQDADRLGIDYRRRGQSVTVQTAAGPVPAWSITLDRVEVAGILVRNVPATVIEGPHPEPALLGMSWLMRVAMRENAGVLYLQER